MMRIIKSLLGGLFLCLIFPLMFVVYSVVYGINPIAFFRSMDISSFYYVLVCYLLLAAMVYSKLR